MDHDQRFKTLIREFFGDFLLLFFAEWAARLDLSSVEWLDKELYPDPPEGSRHAIDLLARVPVTVAADPAATASLLLIHMEIEAPDRTTRLTPRLPYYYHFLRDKHQLPVLPIVLYLKVGLEGIGVDRYVEELWGLEVNRFQYLYVGLPGLDGVKYVQGDNWLGVALSVLMKIPPERVAWLGAEALRRLAQAPLSEQERFLLGECVEAYLPLDEGQKSQFEDLLRSGTYEGVRAMNQTTYEKGIEKGRQEERALNQTTYEKGMEMGIERGRDEERRELVCSLIEDRFGEVPEAVERALERLSAEQLRRLALKIGTAASLADLGLPGSQGASM
jgi:hypothetical protein